jgi:hypothetical protein
MVKNLKYQTVFGESILNFNKICETVSFVVPRVTGILSSIVKQLRGEELTVGREED